MRLWSLHPKYLDSKGLVAVWREGLLAQAVLLGKTKGYRQHPQLERFRAEPSPVACIAEYLQGVYAEAGKRGYRFDAARISPGCSCGRIDVSAAQMEFEWCHLMRKLGARAPDWRKRWLRLLAPPEPHPLFRLVPGSIADWERVPS